MIARGQLRHPGIVTDDPDPHPVIRDLTASIIGSDERQIVERGNPVPPPPPVGPLGWTYLWIVAAGAVLAAVDRFVVGQVAAGFGSLVLGLMLLLMRYGIVVGINRYRWENSPRQRRMYVDAREWESRRRSSGGAPK